MTLLDGFTAVKFEINEVIEIESSLALFLGGNIIMLKCHNFMMKITLIIIIIGQCTDKKQIKLNSKY